MQNEQAISFENCDLQITQTKKNDFHIVVKGTDLSMFFVLKNELSEIVKHFKEITDDTKWVEK